VAEVIVNRDTLDQWVEDALTQGIAPAAYIYGVLCTALPTPDPASCEPCVGTGRVGPFDWLCHTCGGTGLVFDPATDERTPPEVDRG
jgi:hypothetical protein